MLTLSAVQTRNLVFESCYTCDMPIAMTQNQAKAYNESGKVIHCVLGHGTVRRKSVNAQLQESLIAVQDRLAVTETALQNERAVHAETSKAKQCLERRIENGVCPHCKRSFQNVRRHVQRMHKAER